MSTRPADPPATELPAAPPAEVREVPSPDARVLRQKQHFEGVSERYHTERQHPNHLLFKELLWGTFLRGKSDLRRPGLRVLEAMCGYGEGKRLLEEHLRVPVRYEGFDYSEPLVARAREVDPTLSIRVADVTAYEPSPEAIGGHDLVLVIGGLHHVHHQARQVVARLARAVRPGGYFISFEPTDNNPLNRRVRERIYARNAFFDEQTERAFRIGELDEHFHAAGFAVSDRLHCGLLSYILYCNPDCFPLLNRGGPALVRTIFRLERPFFRTPIARALSFATLTLYQRVHAAGDAVGED